MVRMDDLKDLPVVDVNGVVLGRITNCFAESGAIARCDVTLTGNAKRFLGATQDVAQFPTEWIASVGRDRVRLMKAGEQLVRPDEDR